MAKQEITEVSEAIRTNFLTQVLAKLVVDSGGTVRIPKKELAPYLGKDEEGVLYFDIDGDDFVVRAIRNQGGVS